MQEVRNVSRREKKQIAVAGAVALVAAIAFRIGGFVVVSGRSMMPDLPPLTIVRAVSDEVAVGDVVFEGATRLVKRVAHIRKVSDRVEVYLVGDNAGIVQDDSRYRGYLPISAVRRVVWTLSGRVERRPDRVVKCAVDLSQSLPADWEKELRPGETVEVKLDGRQYEVVGGFDFGPVDVRIEETPKGVRVKNTLTMPVVVRVFSSESPERVGLG